MNFKKVIISTICISSFMFTSLPSYIVQKLFVNIWCAHLWGGVTKQLFKNFNKGDYLLWKRL